MFKTIRYKSYFVACIFPVFSVLSVVNAFPGLNLVF